MKSRSPAAPHGIFLAAALCLTAPAVAPAANVVVGWGSSTNGQITPPNGLTNVIAIGAGSSHSLALNSEGQVFSWGGNYYGQANVPGGLGDVTAVAAGGQHSLAVTSQGQVFAWGWNDYGQATVPSRLTNATAVAGGSIHSLALTSDTRVRAWGYNEYGQTTLPTGLTNVLALAAGGYHSMALTAESQIRAWGWNNHGQTTIPSGANNAVAIAAGVYHSLALTIDGHVVAWGAGAPGTSGSFDYGQATVPAGLTNVVAIAAGAWHSLALISDGKVVGWGYNYYGQRTIPTTLSNVVAIAAGGDHSLAIVGDGSPAIKLQPTGQVAEPGATVTLRVMAVGAPTLAYRWSIGGQDVQDGGTVSGASTPMLTLSGIQPNDLGPYAVTVTNAYGAATSSVAAIRFTQTITFTDPLEKTYGDPPFALYATASSGLPVTYTSSSPAVATVSGDTITILAAGTSQITAHQAGNANYLPAPSITRTLTVAKAPVQILLDNTNSVYDASPKPVSATTVPPGLPVSLRYNGSPTTPVNAGTYAVTATVSTANYAGSTNATLTISRASQTITFNPIPAHNLGDPPFSVTATASSGLTVSYAADNPAVATITGNTVTLRGPGTTLVVASQAGNSNYLAAPSVPQTLTVNCLLNISATPGGLVTRDPDLPAYAAGAQVTITATPSPGYGFIRWTGDAIGNANPLTVTMDTNKHIAAVFASTALTLATQGPGSISKTPDLPYYSVGDNVNLTASPARWHAFSGWTDGPTNNPRPVIIGESNAYTAVFTPTTALETVTIGEVSRLAPVGMPAVVVDGTFILAPSTSARGSVLVALSTTFPGGTLLYTLDGSDPAGAATLYSRPFHVSKSCLLRTLAFNATFWQSVPGDPLQIVILPTLTAFTDGGGSVAVDPPAGDYYSDSIALVTATPAPGWAFLQWLGDASGTNPNVAVHMTRDKYTKALFGTAVGTIVVGGGSINPDPALPLYPYGTPIRFTAQPQPGSYFAQWGSAASGTNNPLTFVVTSPGQNIAAVFSTLPSSKFALTVLENGRGHVVTTPQASFYGNGQSVTIAPAPDPGQEFLNWSGSATGTQNPLTVTMNANKIITATFTKRPTLQVGTPLEGLAEDGFRLTLTGDFGTNYAILGSTNLGDWTPIGAVTNTCGTVQFTDPVATNLPHRFYRALAN